jgi:hypothetical protein
MVSRPPCVTCKGIVLLFLLCLPIQVGAEVADITLKRLAARSHLIVVARVTTVEDGPAELQPAGDEYLAVKVATAEVIEIWKGPTTREVRYVASPTRYCDIAGARVGEPVVLLLEKRKDSAIMMIAHLGLPIAMEKKTTNLARGPVWPSFPFSKPISEGLIREIAFENDYRESRTRAITRSRPKLLGLIDYHRLRGLL